MEEYLEYYYKSDLRALRELFKRKASANQSVYEYDETFTPMDILDLYCDESFNTGGNFSDFDRKIIFLSYYYWFLCLKMSQHYTRISVHPSIEQTYDTPLIHGILAMYCHICEPSVIIETFESFHWRKVEEIRANTDEKRSSQVSSEDIESIIDKDANRIFTIFDDVSNIFFDRFLKERSVGHPSLWYELLGSLSVPERDSGKWSKRLYKLSNQKISEWSEKLGK